MHIRYLRDIEHLVCCINRSPSFRSYFKNLTVSDDENIRKINILNSLVDGDSFETVMVEYNMSKCDSTYHSLWLYLRYIALTFSRTSNEDSLVGLRLNKRLINALNRAGFYTVTDIVHYINEGRDLKQITSIGDISAKVILSRLQEFNISVNKEEDNIKYILYNETRNQYFSRKTKWGSLGNCDFYRSFEVAENIQRLYASNDTDAVCIKRVAFTILD